ncbi:hypothetical protein DPMN_159692 [Dreissena polymorpha]|uniref:Uncharacterized protein n=1 Tax=Dreissena polymorpha TaxID=45954 RepID=A0A9D4EPT2_DREPO|nr:hypothetical protein DPMN_159692 [Dreissena polymorpha]
MFKAQNPTNNIKDFLSSAEDVLETVRRKNKQWVMIASVDIRNKRELKHDKCTSLDSRTSYLKENMEVGRSGKSPRTRGLTRLYHY